jgi:hypothetical protein
MITLNTFELLCLNAPLHWPKSGYLACPARFERATYALEVLKMRLNNTKNNGFKVLAFAVA